MINFHIDIPYDRDNNENLHLALAEEKAYEFAHLEDRETVINFLEYAMGALSVEELKLSLEWLNAYLPHKEKMLDDWKKFNKKEEA